MEVDEADVIAGRAARWVGVGPARCGNRVYFRLIRVRPRESACYRANSLAQVKDSGDRARTQYRSPENRKVDGASDRLAREGTRMQIQAYRHSVDFSSYGGVDGRLGSGQVQHA